MKVAKLVLEEAELHLQITFIQTGLLRMAIALKDPDSNSATVIEAIRRRATSSEVSR